MSRDTLSRTTHETTQVVESTGLSKDYGNEVLGLVNRVEASKQNGFIDAQVVLDTFEERYAANGNRLMRRYEERFTGDANIPKPEALEAVNAVAAEINAQYERIRGRSEAPATEKLSRVLIYIAPLAEDLQKKILGEE